jgi:hypothetical protein
MKHTVTELEDKNEPISFSHSILGNYFFETDYSCYEEYTYEIPSELQSCLHPQIHNSPCPVLTNLRFSLTNNTNIPDMWTMFFDGSKTQDGAIVGCVLIDTSQGKMLISFLLELEFTNNTVEYEALVQGLKKPIDLQVKYLKVFGDSEIIIR